MHTADPHQRPFTIFGTKKRQTSFGATHFLRANDRLASLMPAAARMASLQEDVAKALPLIAGSCGVLSFEDGVLVLGAPNAAVAARLKQQVPTLTAALQKRGWQVGSIRLKVQVTQPIAPQYVPRQLSMPDSAVDAFRELGKTLEEQSGQTPLVAALQRLAARRGK